MLLLSYVRAHSAELNIAAPHPPSFSSPAYSTRLFPLRILGERQRKGKKKQERVGNGRRGSDDCASLKFPFLFIYSFFHCPALHFEKQGQTEWTESIAKDIFSFMSMLLFSLMLACIARPLDVRELCQHRLTRHHLTFPCLHSERLLP